MPPLVTTVGVTLFAIANSAPMMVLVTGLLSRGVGVCVLVILAVFVKIVPTTTVLLTVVTTVRVMTSFAPRVAPLSSVGATVLVVANEVGDSP